MTTLPTPQPPILDWQPEKHLRSGDRVWILTDVESFESCYLAWSPPQQLFRVGIYDLATKKIGFAVFGKDLAYAILKAGIAAPPWSSPAPFGIQLHREAHDDDEKGRYRATVELLPIESVVAGVVAEGRRALASDSEHTPNALAGMWSELAQRAASENAIETGILGMFGPFSAGDVKKAIGDPDADVTPVLQRLVKEGKLLPPTGKKRWTRSEPVNESETRG
jgi:hypothetical protein